ncbi:uncharacterized protein LOC111297471 [Durio zibethinus]|uniref:Uncharacterized protein LOC111297471 n=1 Tax=Durio zibethinus TaxID=66656 RepID=A0A6P5Z6D9_DURZI|nr:uncharacterized protein LOC111297471 [Durio zibethinus]
MTGWNGGLSRKGDGKDGFLGKMGLKNHDVVRGVPDSMMVNEGLSCLLNQAEIRGEIHGVAVTRMVPGVSHLLFVDDCLLFLRASIAECQGRNQSKAGGHKRFDRGLLYWAVNYDREIKRMTFQRLKEKVWKKLQGWKGRLLSHVEKAILIQAVAQMDSGLGFRDFEAFNLPLLAKQGWHFLFMLQDLMSQLVSWKASPGAGIMWKVGDGMSIDAWEDKWIRKPPLFKPLGFPNQDGQNLKVASLMEVNRRQWDEDLLEDWKLLSEFFLPFGSITAGETTRLGMVTRDSRGIVKLSAATYTSNNQSSLHAEMHVILFGVGIVKKKGFEVEGCM